MPERPPIFSPSNGRSEKQRKSDYDRQRPSASKRGYNYRWAQARKRYLFDNPLCRSCQGIGVIKSAEVVDHIVPHKGDEKLFWDRSNWQPLCTTCHSRKTATEDSEFAKR